MASVLNVTKHTDRLRRSNILLSTGRTLQDSSVRRRSAGNAVPGGNEKHVRPIELKPLIGRLNDVCRRGLEAAAGVTALRTHYNVEIEHLLIGLLDRSDTDLAAILRKWDDRAGPLAGRPQPLARADEDRQRACACALARHRRYGQAGLAAGLRRAGRKPRALGPSALGIARRRHAGAARARGVGSPGRRFHPTRSRATISRSAPTLRRRRRRPARRSAPKRPAPARAKCGRAGPAPSTSSPST